MKLILSIISIFVIITLIAGRTNGRQSLHAHSGRNPGLLDYRSSAKLINMIPSSLTYHSMLKTEDRLVSDACQDHFQLYEDALTKDFKSWALQMFDASTKVPESVMSGATVHLGNFDQCLEVKAYLEDGQHAFNGQHCGTNIHLSDGGNFSLNLQIAACVPSTCTPEEVQTILQQTLSPVNAQVNIPAQNCYIEGDKPPLDAGSWVFISIIIVLAAEVIVSTLCDYLNFKFSNEKLNTIMKSFSARSNLNSLLSTTHARGSIECMHGIRAISLMWIVLGHRYENTVYVPKMNNAQMYKMFEDVSMQLIFNALLAVDTFFLMSGFLVSYLSFKDFQKGKKFNPIIYYVHRYLRLTTSYAVIIGFFLSLGNFIGYGPTWKAAVNFRNGICKATWWTGLLYVDNYVLMKEYTDIGSWSVCVGQGWYLTVDMQLAWVAPLVILPLWYWSKWSTKFFLLLILASCFAPFTSTYINEYYMAYYAFDTDFQRFFNNLIGMYSASYMRATPYLMGICLGYFMIKYPKNISMPKWAVLCGWIVSTTLALVLIFAPAVIYQPDYVYDVVASSFYAGFHKLAWSAVIMWIIISCHYQLGGPVNRILSWRGWLPFSRLTYCIYLTHMYLIVLDISQIRTLMYFNHYTMVQQYCGDLIFSVILATCLHLLVEAPTLGLLRAFLKPKPAADQTKLHA